MPDPKPITIPFTNKGIVQRRDPSLLGEGEYVEIKNLVSIQDGALSLRPGATRMLASSPGSLIHTIKKFRLAAGLVNQKLYFGEGQDIWRGPADFSAGFTKVQSALPDWGKFWTAQEYHAGSSGTPYFFISASQMLKDTGTLSTLQRWGILPALRPPGAAAQTVTAVDCLNASTLTVTFASGDLNTYKNASIVQASDLSRGGKSQDGYDSEDPIHVVVTLSDPTIFTDIRLQFDVSASAGDWVDYYEKAIVPSSLSSYVAQQQTASQALEDRILKADRGFYDNYGLPEDYSRYVAPEEIPPMSASSSEDLYLRKQDFLKISGAGGSGKTWANIKAVRLVAKSGGVGTITFTKVELAGGSGPNSESGGRTKYKYRYTFRNPVTGNEGNPSEEMFDEYAVSANRQPVAVTVYGTDDPQITGAGSIAIYRTGGIYGDYRLVGYATNPGGYASSVVFTDNAEDADLAQSSLLEYDNDPPVRSTLPVQFVGSLQANYAAGQSSIGVGVSTAALTIGSTVYIGSGANAESCTIQALGSNSMSVWLQRAHSTGERVSCDSVVGSPCRLSCQAYESLFLAGDPNNPHVLYKSKKARPESFPIVNLTTGVAHTVNVGSPSNPIVAITDFSDIILCLNLNSIYVVQLYLGVMRAPTETPSKRGLIAAGAWCKTNGEIWFLSYDGIYSWSGGEAILRSRQIDWMFKGKTVNGLAPIDLSDAYREKIRFEFHKNAIRVACFDTMGNSITLYCDLSDPAAPEGKWHILRPAMEAGNVAATYTAFYSDVDTGNLLCARNYNTGSTVSAYIYQEDSNTLGDNSSTVDYALQTGWFNTRSLNNQISDFVIELENVDAVSLKTYYNFSTSVDETITIPASPTGGRHRYSVPVKLDGNGLTEGKQCFAMQLRFEGATKAALSLYSITLNVIELAQTQRGKAYDWNALEYPHDKRLDQLVIVYNAHNQSIPLNLDILSGIAGNTQTNAVATFTLTGNNRAVATLPIKLAAGGREVVAKAVRLRPSTPTSDFEIFDWNVTYEKYPADITLFTEPDDCGTPYLKYFQQIVLDVDTGGVAASVVVEVDGVDVQTLSVSTTFATRRQNLTLHQGISGKKARIRVTPGTNGKFQMFSKPDFIVAPADKGPVMHSFDWDSLGYPYDKKLKQIIIEYEVTTPATMVMDGLFGLTGAQTVSQIMEFNLVTGGRRLETFLIPDGKVVKMVRIYPKAAPLLPTDFREWKYTIDKDNYPPDTIAATEWDACGYPFEKVMRSFTLGVDTSGVAANVAFQADGVTYQNFSVNSGTLDRARILTVQPNIVGKLFRIVPTPGAGGKFQLFTNPPIWNFAREPAPLTYWCSGEIVLGYEGYKFLKQVWLHYISAGSVDFRIYRDGGQLLYTKRLPPHTYRDVEHFLIPLRAGSILNKSIRYKFEVESVADEYSTKHIFKVYGDGSRVESKQLSGDQRQGYNQNLLWEAMQVQS